MGQRNNTSSGRDVSGTRMSEPDPPNVGQASDQSLFDPALFGIGSEPPRDSKSHRCAPSLMSPLFNATGRRTAPSFLSAISPHGQVFILLVLVATGCILAAVHIPTSWYENRLVPPFDHCWYGTPNQVLTDQCIHQGELPLWNPLIYCGTLHMANPQVQFFYPPNLIRSLLTFHPTPWKTHVGVVLLWLFHLHLATLGAFLLARSHHLSIPASLVTALTFAFGHIYLNFILSLVTLAPTLSWLPLLLLSARCSFLAENAGTRRRSAVAGGLVYGMILLAGYPQFALYMGIMFGLYAGTYWIIGAIRRPHQKSNQERRFPFSSLMCIGMVMGTIGALVAAALLLPATQFSAASTRAGDVNYPEGNELIASFRLNTHPLLALRGFLVFPGTKSAPLMPGAGILYGILALAAVLGRYKVKCLPYLVVLFAIVDFTIGPGMPLASMLHAAAPFQLSNWVLAISLAALPLSVLAGFGVETITSPKKNYCGNLLWTLFLIATGGGAVSVLSQVDDAILPIQFVHLAVPITGIGVMIAATWIKRPALMRIVLGILVFVELMAWTIRYVPIHFVPGKLVASPITIPQSENRLDTAPAFNLDNRRGSRFIPTNHCIYDLRPIVNGSDPLHLRVVYDVLTSPQYEGKYMRSLTSKCAEDNHHWALFLGRPFWLASRWVSGPLPPRERLFPPTENVFLPEASCPHVPRVNATDVRIGLVSPRAKTMVATDPGLLAALASPVHVRTVHVSKQLVYRLPLENELKAYSAVRLDFESECPVSILATVNDSDQYHNVPVMKYSCESGRSSIDVPVYAAKRPEEIHLAVTVEGGQGTFRLEGASFLMDPEDEDSKIRITDRTANAVKVKLEEVPDWRILLFTDAFYPGWRAFVDGEAVPIMRANDAFKAIEVPPGTHDVRFQYHSPRVAIGIAISLASLAGCVLYLALSSLRAQTS